MSNVIDFKSRADPDYQVLLVFCPEMASKKGAYKVCSVHGQEIVYTQRYGSPDVGINEKGLSKGTVVFKGSVLDLKTKIEKLSKYDFELPHPSVCVPKKDGSKKRGNPSFKSFKPI
jgi:hypothetical protein